MFKDKSSKTNLQTLIGVILFFGVLGVLAQFHLISNKLSSLLVPLGIYMMLAVSLNLVVGVLGELSLGHAGFMCIGAYVGGLFSIFIKDIITSPTIRLIVSMILGGLVSAFVGFLVGIPILRLRGDYLAIVTLGFGEIIRSIFGNFYIAKDSKGIHFAFTNPIQGLEKGSEYYINGAQGISAPRDTNIIIVTITLVITLIVLMNFINSKSGRACLAIQNNVIATDTCGINVTKYRIIAFSLASFFAGVAGVLYACNYAITAPKKFDYNLSILVLVFVVLGGLGKLRGTLISTLILYSLPELLREFAQYRMIVYAIALVAIMVLGKSPMFEGFRSKIFNFTDKIKKKVFGLFKLKKGVKKNGE